MSVDPMAEVSRSTASAGGRRPLGLVLRMGRVRLGCILVLLVVGVAVVGPFLAPHGETEYLGPPSVRRIDGARFGTDFLGQDVWSRFLAGGRTLVILATVATVIGVVLGATIGLAAAVARPLVADVLMRSVDVLLAVPQLLLVLVAMTTVGPEPWLIVAAVTVITAPRVARVIHGAAAPVARSDFVLASEALGESTAHIVRTDVLPNVSGPLMVEVGIRFTYAIGIIASIAFLGFVPDANRADWGVMVQENRAGIATQPWGVVLPGLAIAALALGAGLVADGFARVNARIGRR